MDSSRRVIDEATGEIIDEVINEVIEMSTALSAETVTATPEKKRRIGKRFTPDQVKEVQEVFLTALEKTANVRQACLVAGISHTTIYRWQEHDAEFGMKFRHANTNANWVLFGEAWHRAMEGETEFVVSAGKLVYGTDGKPLTTKKKSDRILELLLKARLPEFNKQTVEHSGSIDVTGAKDELLTKLTRIREEYGS